MTSKEDKIEVFWQWFVKNESIIKDCIELDSTPKQAYIVNQLNELILDLGLFTWDIGLNNSNEWFLTISPNGSEKFLSISQHIMLEAPEFLNWTFHASRPPKNWDRTFIVHSFDMEEIEIDASEWFFHLHNEEHDQNSIIIEAKGIEELDQETANEAAHQFLVSELGEKITMEGFSNIEISGKLENKLARDKKSISELKTLFY